MPFLGAASGAASGFSTISFLEATSLPSPGRFGTSMGVDLLTLGSTGLAATSLTAAGGAALMGVILELLAGASVLAILAARFLRGLGSGSPLALASSRAAFTLARPSFNLSNSLDFFSASICCYIKEQCFIQPLFFRHSWGGSDGRKDRGGHQPFL